MQEDQRRHRAGKQPCLPPSVALCLQQSKLGRDQTAGRAAVACRPPGDRLQAPRINRAGPAASPAQMAPVNVTATATGPVVDGQQASWGGGRRV